MNENRLTHNATELFGETPNRELSKLVPDVEWLVSELTPEQKKLLGELTKEAWKDYNNPKDYLNDVADVTAWMVIWSLIILGILIFIFIIAVQIDLAF